jgi:hypothetical protein
MKRTAGLDPCRISCYSRKSAARLVPPWFTTARAPYLAVMTHANRAAVFYLSLLQLNAWYKSIFYAIGIE